MTEKMDFAGGKYTVVNDNGKLTALRHGEPWGRDLVGDNLVYWMLVDSLRLRAQRDALLTVLKELTGHINERFSGGVWDRARAAIKAVEENRNEH